MNRFRLFIVCLLGSWCLVQAQDPTTEVSVPMATAAVLPNDQAVEQAKWLTTRQCVDLDVQFEGVDDPHPPHTGFFISTDGLLLTLISLKQPVKKISVVRFSRDSELYIGQADNSPADLLARDASTGLSLIKTSLRCRQPLKLVAKLELEKIRELAEWRTFRESRMWNDKGDIVLHSLRHAHNMKVDDLRLKSALVGQYGSRNEPDTAFSIGSNGFVFVKDNLVQAIAYANSEARATALAGDEARQICDRLLGETRLPLLPTPDQQRPLIVEELPASDSGNGESVPLQVDLKNGDRRVVRGVILDDRGHVVIDYQQFPYFERARCRQRGILLDVTLEDIQDIHQRSLTVLKLSVPVKNEFVTIGLDAPTLAIGEPLFDQRARSDNQAISPCAKLVQLDATLETFDLTRTQLLRCEPSLPAGTALFNRAGRFIGLCLATPDVFANTVFVMPADQVWKLTATTLNRHEFNDVSAATLLQKAGQQAVKTYHFKAQSAGPDASDFHGVATTWLSPITPELLEKIYQRLRGAFPELQFALDKDERSLIVVLEPKQDPELLGVVNYWIQRLMRENEPKTTGTLKAVASVEEEFKPSTSATGRVKKSPAGGNLEERIRDLIRRYQTASKGNVEGELNLGGVKPRIIPDPDQGNSPDPQSVLRKELTQLTAKQFDQRHQQRLKELKTLEGRLESLRTELQKRQGLRDEIIRKRVADLLSEENLLKWDSGPAEEPPKPRVSKPGAN